MTTEWSALGGTGLSPAQQREFERQIRAAGIDVLDSARMAPRPRAEYEPLSFAQERLWFLDQLDPGSAAYNVAVAVRLRGALDVPALRCAFEELVRRHETLRTTIESDPDSGGPAQHVHAVGRFTLDVIDVERLAGADSERFATAQATWPFDLARGPLMRTSLLRRSADLHTLLLTMHHVVVDAWSMGVVVTELADLYSAFHHGRTSALPDPIHQYADYAVWQREWLRGDRLEPQLTYWRRQLAGLPVLSLPTDYPRTPVPGSAGAQVTFAIPATLRDSVADLCRREGTTMFMALLAAFQALVSQRSGQVDFAVGTPVAGRGQLAWANLIGFFVNTLVLRADLTGDPSFHELLARVRDTTLAAYDHQDLPFERLVEELQPERTLDRTPLFQVMFALQNAAGPVEFDELAVVAEPVDTLSSMFDILFTLEEQPTGLSGLVTYRTSMFTAATIGRMVDHYRQLLEMVVRAPDTPVADLCEPVGAERHRLLVEWNPPVDPSERDPLAIDLFERRVDACPDAVALSCGGERLSYAAVGARANQLAHHLGQRGVGPETIVAVCLDRTPQLVVALLAILEAGGAYLPVDPTHPPPRLAAIIDDAGATVVVTEERHLSRLPCDGRSTVCVDQDRAEIEAQPTVRCATRVDAANLAYVRYTSGSTGRPKGVAVTVGNQAQFVRAAADLGLDPTSRVLARSNVSFDVAEAELLAPLCQGGTVLLLAGDEARDPRATAAALDADACTIAQATPSMWNAVLDEGFSRATEVTLLVAGEALTRDLAGRLRAQSKALINLYGPTEATVYATIAEVDGAEQLSPPIGRPFGAAFLTVLDTRMRLVRQGVVGELYVGGGGVGRGYLGQPGVTAARFVPDPYGGAPGARLYRTGDLVRWRDGGMLEFLGRVDDQVKIRGVRIEPGEVRAVLVRHESVADAAVVADGVAEVRLVAYVVPAAGASIDPRALREHLVRQLPPQLVPSAFVEFAALPRNANGKLDRAALPPPGVAWAASASRPPRTAVEELLVGVCADLLKVPAVGVDDDFFALGGHSLLVTRLVARVRELFSVELPLRAVFETPTVAGLAQAIRANAGPPRPLPAISSADRAEPLPLSFAQERLWFLSQLDPGGVAYNIAAAVRLTGPLRIDALQHAVDELARRHEILRTTIYLDPATGLPAQRVHPASTDDLVVVDVPESERERRAFEDAVRPFDLLHGPLMRTSLLRHSSERHTLLWSMHHVVVDAWSIGVLVDELARLYSDCCHDRPPSLAPPALQYADYAAWQREWLRGDLLDHQLAYWRHQLTGLPDLDLPTDRPRWPAEGHEGEVVSFALPVEATAALEELCRREGVTLFMALLAVYQTLLARYSGQSEFAVGTPVAGRVRPALENMVGFFVNTLVLRADLSGAPTFRDVLARVRETAIGAFDHQDVPFERLVEDLQPERALGRTPLFQVMFGMQNAPSSPVELEDVDVVAELTDTRAAKFDLALYFRAAEGTVAGDLTYASELFGRATIERLVADFQGLLAAALADPEQPVAALPLASGGVAPALGSGRGQSAAAVEAVVRPAAAAPTGSALEQLFAVAMASALGLERIGAGEDFFKLGGHSLMAMRLLGQLADALGVGLPLRQFFDRPTAAACAATALELSDDPAGLEVRAALVLEVASLPDDEVVRMLDSRQPGSGADGAGANG